MATSAEAMLDWLLTVQILVPMAFVPDPAGGLPNRQEPVRLAPGR